MYGHAVASNDRWLQLKYNEWRRGKCLTQAQLEESLRGPEFQLDTRYGEPQHTPASQAFVTTEPQHIAGSQAFVTTDCFCSKNTQSKDMCLGLPLTSNGWLKQDSG